MEEPGGEGPLAVVTGGSSGIGLAVAARLRARGFRLVLVGRDAARLAAARAELGAAGVETVELDVADAAAVAAFAAALLAREPRLALLVANAGIPGRQGALDATPEVARHVMAVNYLGLVHVTRALWPALVAARGSVVNVCSVAGTVAVPSAAPYSASKHAALAWSRALAAQARRVGVHVLTVNPGPVATPGFPQADLRRHRLARRTVISDARCADAIVRGLDRGRGEIYVPAWWRAAAILQVLLPGTVARLSGRVRP